MRSALFYCVQLIIKYKQTMNNLETMNYLEQQVQVLSQALENLKKQMFSLKESLLPKTVDSSGPEEPNASQEDDAQAETSEQENTTMNEQQPADASVADTPIQPLQTEETTTEQIEKPDADDFRADVFKKLDELASHQLEIQNAMNQISNQHLLQIDRLESSVDDKQEKLEYIIQNVQEDRYRKDKMSLLNRCLFQAELIRKTIYEYPSQSEHIKDKEQYLLNQLREVVTGIETSLQYEGVEARHFAAVGEKVNPQYQEVTSVIETDDATKDNTVAESLNPGYVWTLPYILKAKVNSSGDEIKTYQFLMKAEQVVAYKFISK